MDLEVEGRYISFWYFTEKRKEKKPNTLDLVGLGGQEIRALR
jgi:hypothetical protein